MFLASDSECPNQAFVSTKAWLWHSLSDDPFPVMRPSVILVNQDALIQVANK